MGSPVGPSDDSAVTPWAALKGSREMGHWVGEEVSVGSRETHRKWVSSHFPTSLSSLWVLAMTGSFATPLSSVF